MLATRGTMRLLGSVALLASAACSINAHHGAVASHAHWHAHSTVTANMGEVTTANLLSPVVWQTIGHSVEGRPLRMQRVGHGRRRVLWIGGIHGDEPQGVVATASLASAFEQARLENRVTLVIVEDDNPDGRVRHTRDNANHVDLNRNFPARNFDRTNSESGRTPLSQPESRALYDLIRRVHPDLVISCHASRGHQFINYDGPAKAIAERFSAKSGLPVEASNSLGFGTPGSLGSLVGIDRGIPILTIELLRGSSPTADWYAIRRAAVSVIAR
ncbi:MAG: murein peptide amidase [Actinomycetota bacterium]|nr:murein peptide amidase [Actinomycetota bacterium]